MLDGFWDEARRFSLTLPTESPITAASFCTARRKITADLLLELLGKVHEEYHRNFPGSSRWRGRQVLAVDGVKFNLQRDPDLTREFGVPDGAHCPQALASTVYDVCAKLPVEQVVSARASCEREHLLSMFSVFREGDLLILDRGHPSHEVIQALRQKGMDLLIRVPASSTFKAIDAFREDGLIDSGIQIDPPKGAPDTWGSMFLRAVKLVNHSGEASYFITTLDEDAASTEAIRALHQLR